MRTGFSLTQLADPLIADAEHSLRACMHCGICTATCPTYVLLGDERDGPRGRIVMMQKMLEEGGAPSAETVLHVDRCLSCLACRTACPSSVDYARLVDVARAHIETHYKRPLGERLLRWFIAHALTRPNHIRFGLALARVFSPISRALPGRLGAIARVGATLPRPERNRLPAKPAQQSRAIALLPGCVQSAVAPAVDEALTRVLARRGIAAVPLEGAGCCGAIAHHLGKTAEAKAWARRLIESFKVGYEFVIIDMAPLVSTVDVRAASRIIDSYLLVIEWGATKMDSVQYALSNAPAVQSKMIGAVLNKVDFASLGRYAPYGYSYHHYYGRNGYSRH